MRGILDDELLGGVHEVRIVVRPRRDAIAVQTGDTAELLARIDKLTPLWGSAITPLVPVDKSGVIDPLYARAIPCACIDGMDGVHPFELFDLEHSRVDLNVTEDPLGQQLAVALLDYKKQKSYLPLEVVELGRSDPWREIYAACLGTLPAVPDPAVLRRNELLPHLRFEDFLRVSRVSVQGSLEDLLLRLEARDRMTPRKVSMLHLPYGNSGSSSLRSATTVLPEPWFPQYDAGPNVIVVCSPGSVEDAALLWNLRGAHGDSRPLPLGIPVADANPAVFAQLALRPGLSRNGFAARSLYVTSASVPTERLETLVGQSDSVGIARAGQMLTFGASAGWARDEVLVWSKGVSQFVPMPPGHQNDALSRAALSQFAYFHMDLSVSNAPYSSGRRHSH